ncbi:MAG: efflux RND transporter permease subunit [Clostridiaceae bacterium]
MNFISKYSVKKPVTIVMAVLVIIILGFVSLTNTKTDLLPSMNLPYAVISTTYYGASPDEVELMITKPIESSMATVSNIKNIQSVSQENMSLVILEFQDDTNMDSALIEMRENLDMVKAFMPEEIGNPMITKINPDMMPIMSFSMSVSGKTEEENSQFVEDILPRFESIEGVASVNVIGATENQIQVNLNQEKIDKVNEDMKQKALEQAREQIIASAMANGMTREMAESMAPNDIEFPGVQITKDMVSGILKGQNFSMPAGYINDNNSDYLVRVGDEIEDLEGLKALTIISSDLMNVSLEDVSDVNIVDGRKDSYSKVNGENSVLISIQKQNDATTTEVASLVENKMEDVKDEFPNVEIITLMNQAEYIDQSVKSVTNNLLYGAILAIFILLLFLRDIKPTIIIALAIPISVMTAFIMIYFAGITLNIISMGGLALGIGMLVDNSIVVIENIYRLRNEGASVKEAALKGASQVAGAITASTLTTVSVFIPVVFMSGFTAQIFKEMALTISFSLIASLIIALSLVPMMASKMMVRNKEEKQHKILEKVKIFYTKVLKLALNNKLITMVLVFALFGLSIFGALKMGTELFPETDQGQIAVTVKLPSGESFEDKTGVLDKISNDISEIGGVATVSSSISSDIMMSMMTGGGQNEATINVLMEEDTSIKTKDVAKKIQDISKNYDYEILVQEQSMDMSALGGSGVSINIKGYDLDTLETIATDIGDILEGAEGTKEVDNGISKTSPELKITVNREKSIEKGLTTAQVFVAINDAIKAQDKTSTLSLSGKDTDIYVADSLKDEEYNIEKIKSLTVDSPMGDIVKISDIAEIEIENGFGVINRDNQSRVISASCKIEDGYNIGLVGDEIQAKLDKYNIPDGYSVSMQGENEQIKSYMSDLTKALILAIVLIYMIMASQFQSLLYPLIVMFSIPLAFTGGFLGLIITRMPLSIVAFIGLIILTGVVVNNGIVLVDYINQLKKEGMTTYDAIIEAGNTRLRPIVMTALTTILALSTMAIGIGDGAELMQPMAITTIGGLLYGTLLTLIVVPVMYSGFDRLRRKK